MADLISYLAQDAMHAPAHSLRQVGSAPRIRPIVDLSGRQLVAADHKCPAYRDLQATTALVRRPRRTLQVGVTFPSAQGRSHLEAGMAPVARPLVLSGRNTPGVRFAAPSLVSCSSLSASGRGAATPEDAGKRAVDLNRPARGFLAKTP